MSMECASPAASTVGLESLEEWDQPSPAPRRFCRQVSLAQFELEGISQTEMALQGLYSHLERHPEEYRKVLRRRKQEALESSGPLSFLKARFLSVVHGEQHQGNTVSDEELQTRVSSLTTGMSRAFVYAQEAKGVRRSDRLKGRRALSQINSRVGSPLAHNRPPTPLSECLTPGGISVTSSKSHTSAMCPPPPVMGEGGQVIKKSKSLLRLGKRKKEKVARDKENRMVRHASVVSMQEELLAKDHRQRLKPTRASPSHSPSLKTPRTLRTMRAETPLHQVLSRVLEQKFANFRSPSPAPGQDNNSFTAADFSF